MTAGSTHETIFDWYRRAFRQAAQQQGLPTDPTIAPLAIKLLEETIELAFSLGLSSPDIQRHFYRALNKEELKHARGELPGEPLGELADLVIVFCVLVGVGQFETDDIDAAVDEKMEINALREWAVNEFGALSHRKKAPQESQPPAHQETKP